MNLIRTHFVPVALNTDRLADTEAGRFFRQLMKRWPQGLWVVTPEGTTLGFHYHQPKSGDNYKQNQQRWVDDTRKMLTEARDAAGTLTPRDVKQLNPYPDRGVGFQKDGGVRLALSVIGLRGNRQEGPPAVDSFLVSREEWATFAAADQQEWSIPATVGRKFAPILSPLTDSIYVPRPADVRQAKITARVLRQADGLIVVRYRGEWQSVHNRDGNPKFPIRADSRGEGIGVYDSKTKRMQSLIMVLQGSYENGGTTTPTASIVEWVASVGD